MQSLLSYLFDLTYIQLSKPAYCTACSVLWHHIFRITSLTQPRHLMAQLPCSWLRYVIRYPPSSSSSSKTVMVSSLSQGDMIPQLGWQIHRHKDLAQLAATVPCPPPHLSLSCDPHLYSTRPPRRLLKLCHHGDGSWLETLAAAAAVLRMSTARRSRRLLPCSCSNVPYAADLAMSSSSSSSGSRFHSCTFSNSCAGCCRLPFLLPA